MDTTPQEIRKSTSHHHRRTWKQASAVTGRWLHLYVSLVSFGVVLFFSVTGLTLNHPTWFGANREVTIESQGQVDLAWVKTTSNESVAKLEISEYLRATHHARGAVKDFSIDDLQCVVGFRAPGYSADAFIERDTGKYQFVQTSFGFIAVLNDLHKGRDSGSAWSLMIDISAIFLILVSLTGFWLLFHIRRRRAKGFATSLVGMIAVIVVYLLWVPR